MLQIDFLHAGGHLIFPVWLQVMDMFVEQTHEIRHEWRDNERPMRFTDTRLDEQERAISLKMVPMSLVMEGSSGKSYLCNLIDTPGAQLSFATSFKQTPLRIGPTTRRVNLTPLGAVSHE